MNYFEFLTVDPIDSAKRTRVTKVTPKKYGFRVQMFNNYITLYYLKIEINADKSAKISWKVDKNYQPINRYTTYHGANGEEISRKEYYNQKKTIIMNEKIIEGNKLIAEFMGLSYCDRYQYEGWYQNNEYNYRICDFNSLEYHSSWNWLIPVVEKIEKTTAWVNIKGCAVNISTIVETAAATKMDAVWLSVVEFIKWYNKQK